MLTILGINDEQTVCDGCGRMELKSTVVLADSERSEIGRYGSTCAAKLLNRENGVKWTGATVNQSAATKEWIRRDSVKTDFRRAIAEAKAGNHLAAMQWRNEAVTVGLIRPDEVALNAKLLAWARAFRRNECGVWQ